MNEYEYILNENVEVGVWDVQATWDVLVCGVVYSPQDRGLRFE